MTQTKDEVLAALERAANETHALAQDVGFSEAHVRWMTGATRLLQRTFGEESSYLNTFRLISWQHRGTMLVSYWEHGSQIQSYHQQAYIRGLNMARGLLLGAYDELNDSNLDEVKKLSQGVEAGQLVAIINLVERRLRKGVHKKPENERDIQDIFETLLVGADIDFSREKATVEFSSKKYIPDFTVSALDLAIELKICLRADREKEMISEINDDIAAYSTKWKNILFVVYDGGFIRDVETFCEPFVSDSVMVKVVKH